MGEPGCQGCRELQRRVAELEATVRDLQARLSLNSSNSSLPPSANPPSAPPPVVKKPTGRRPGAQPGHPPALRQRLPADRVHTTHVLAPTHCRRCQAPLPAPAGPDDPEPTWHQVAELPPRPVQITEYQGQARTCPCCGEVTHAAIPAEVRASSIGPRLAAALAFLTGRCHLSKRAVEEVAEVVFGAPVALGTVSHLERQVAASLAAAHAEVAEACTGPRSSTSMRRAGKGRPPLLAVGGGDPDSGPVRDSRRPRRRRAEALLGEAFAGILCTDRWVVYERVPVGRRQLAGPTSNATSRRWWTGPGPGRPSESNCWADAYAVRQTLALVPDARRGGASFNS